jgi:hypothetical protein
MGEAIAKSRACKRAAGSEDEDPRAAGSEDEDPRAAGRMKRPDREDEETRARRVG